MEKSIIQRLIDAGIITKNDIDEYNKQNSIGFNTRGYRQAQSQTTHSEIKHNGILVNFNPEDIVNGKYVVPSNIRYIRESAFKDCKCLKEIDLSNVEVISANAFANCTNLSRVKFGENLKVIDKYAFWMCENLEAIDLDIQGTKIHWTAFMHCPNWIDVSTILQAKYKAGEQIEWYHK